MTRRFRSRPSNSYPHQQHFGRTSDFSAPAVVYLCIVVNKYSEKAIGIVGFRGYSGAELLRLLGRHPYTRPVLLEHRADAPAGISPLKSDPHPTLPATADAISAAKLDLVFLATPPAVSLDLAPAILQAGVKVVDLSGAFRLGDPEIYTRWYGEEHTAPALFREAVYGLPEFYRDRIRTAQLIANPGCYPTAANLVLRPLIQANVLDRAHGVICDAKSGVSGAGRKPSLKTSFGEVADNFSAYGFSDHRHVPEVLQHSGLSEHQFTFTAQLLPLYRGILETIYLQTISVASAADLLAIYEDCYGNEPFLRLYQPGQLPDLHAVQNTNFCDIGFHFNPSTRRAVIVAVEDNLVKGAAGQAIQNMNLMLGFAEREGLL